jgi:hypothetical protein
MRHSCLKVGGHGPDVPLGQRSFEGWHLRVEGFPSFGDGPVDIGVGPVPWRSSQPFQIGRCRNEEESLRPGALPAPSVARCAMLIEHSRATPQLRRRIWQRVANRAVRSRNPIHDDFLMPRHVRHPARSIHVGLSGSNGEWQDSDNACNQIAEHLRSPVQANDRREAAWHRNQIVAMGRIWTAGLSERLTFQAF